MSKRSLKTRLYTMYVIALIPLIIFGIYKNGVYLYNRGYVAILGLFRPIIIILISIAGALIGTFISEYKKSKKINLSFIKDRADVLIESIILSMLLPLKSSPIVVFVITLVFSLLPKNIKLNRVALMFLVITLVNQFLGLNDFQNIYQSSTSLNYDGFDLFLGLGAGGMCSTSILLIVLSLIYLSINKLYKRDLVYSSLLTYAMLCIIPNMINGNYNSILDILFSYNIIFVLVFVSPNLYSSSYTMKGQILSGIIISSLTYFLILYIPYSSVFVSILLVNLLTGIFDKVFVVK